VPPAANLDQQTRDVAHHVMQEGVGRDLNDDPLARRSTVSRSTRRIGEFDWHSEETEGAEVEVTAQMHRRSAMRS